MRGLRNQRWMLVPPWVMAMTVLPFPLFLLVEWLVMRLIMQRFHFAIDFHDPGWGDSVAITLSFSGAFYGFWRGFMFHPVFHRPYHAWLMQTPWRPGMPLPLGPVRLSWQDAVPLVVVAGMGMWLAGADPAIPLAGMLAGYLVGIAVMLFRTGEYGAFMLLLAVFPATWHVWPRWRLVAAILLVMYGIAVWGLARGWRKYPWRLREQPGEKPPKQRELGWPFGRLNAYEPAAQPKMKWVAGVSLLGGWYLFSWLHLGGEDLRDPKGVAMTTAMFGCFAALGRLITYAVLQGGVMPIRARILRGILLMPGHDRVYIAPIIMALVSIGGVGLMAKLEVYPPLLAGLMAVVIPILGFSLPPTRRNWLLTGHYRMVLIRGSKDKKQVPVG